ncbi:unnamed protein product [Acanthosepion pharaonis]|uniref:PDZ domain-containing protein n=1 Tax=Acanthosepion pharaonis TaxID=158019 RepID=A0A812BU15_ACAPH|nr:unnamed protein product [Sepia pharaonis]
MAVAAIISLSVFSSIVCYLLKYLYEARVFANSPAEGYLQRGDIILNVNNCDAAELSHKKAQDLFNSAGGQILLSIKRGQYLKKEPPKPKDTKAYRTVPLELTGPGGVSGPKLGGSSIDLGVNYNKLAGRPVETIMQRQSSKPWEDQEMLYKVHDTLSHISYPYAPPGASTTPAAPGGASKISCMNMYSSAPQSAVAPPPYIPGPPTEPETNYVDPFPSYKPAPVAAEDEEDYEFVPVRQRRNQFNKNDFIPQERKPIKPQRPPPVFAPAPPAPAPKPRSTPVTPTPAPTSYSAPVPFMPADGEVVKPDVPAWAGTLTNVGGPKLWDTGMKPSSKSKSARSVSPTKKAAATGDFKPTQTQVLDFTGETDDGTRIMHLQYNSPLDMYSKENVAETLQGQTQAALGGGNTVKWLSHIQQIVTEDSQPATSFPPVEGTHFRRNASVNQQLQQVPVAKPSAAQSEPQYRPVSSKATGATTSKLPFTPVSFRPKEIPIPKPLQVPPPPVDIPILSQQPTKPIPVQLPTSFPTQFKIQSEQKPLPSGFVPKEWAPVKSPKFNFLKKSATSPTIPNPPNHGPVSKPEPEPVYRSWGAVTAVPPPTLKLAKESETEPKQAKTPDADRDRVYQELTAALQCSKTFPRGTYAAKEKMSNSGSFFPSRNIRMSPQVPPTAAVISHVTPPSSTPTFAHVSPPGPPPAQSFSHMIPSASTAGFAHVSPPFPSNSLPISHVSSPMQTPTFAHVSQSSALPSAHVSPPTQSPKFGHVSPPVPVYPSATSYKVAMVPVVNKQAITETFCDQSHMKTESVSVFEQEADLEEEYVSASEPEAEYDSAPEPKAEYDSEPKAEPVSVPEPKPELVSAPEPKAEPVSAPEPKAEHVSAPEPKAEPISEPEPKAEPISPPELKAEPVSVRKLEAEPTSESEPVAKSVSEPEAEAASQPEPVAEAASQSEPVAEVASQPELVAEPASESGPVAEPAFQPEPVAEPASESRPVAESASESGPVAESASEPGPVAEPASQPEPVAETASEPGPVAEHVSEPGPVAETASKPGPVVEPGPVTEPASEPGPVAEPASEPGPVAEPASEPPTVEEPASEPESTLEPASESEPTAETASASEPTAGTASAPESEPEPEVKQVQVKESVSAPETEVKPVPVPIPESETISKPELETKPITVPESDAKPVSEQQPEHISVVPHQKHGTEAEPNSLTKLEAEPVSAFEAESENISASEVVETISMSVPEAEPILVQESEIISLPHPVSVSEEKSEAYPVSQPESQPESISESVSVTELEPISIPEPEPEVSFEFQIEDDNTLELEASELHTSQDFAASVADKETVSSTVVETPPVVTPSDRRRRRRQIAAFLTGPADESVKTSAESVEPALKQAPEVPSTTPPKTLPKPVTEPKSKPVSDSAPEPVPKSGPVLIAKANIEDPAKQVIISKPPAAQEPKVDASKQQYLKAALSPKPSEVSVAPPKRSECVPKTNEKPVSRSPLSQARTAQMKERTREGKESKDSSLPRWLIPLILFILLGAAVAALFLYREKYPAVITVRGREIESSPKTEELSLPDVAEAASQMMDSIASAEDLVPDVSENVETILDQGDYVCTDEIVTPEPGAEIEDC